MHDEQLLRYSRQIMLPAIDVAGQARLRAARVLLIGLGGLGSPVATYLASAGVGTLVVSDHDTVDLTNLQRQTLHTTARIGWSKVDSAKAQLAALNPECEVLGIAAKLSGQRLAEEVAAADLVVDASDNFATRFALNAACVAARTPLVSGAAIRYEGQVTLFANDGTGPCYRCLYSDDDAEEQQTCSTTGVLAPLVGVVGSLQATEALKWLLGIGEPLDGRLLLCDLLSMEWRTLRLRRDPHCPVCAPYSSD